MKTVLHARWILPIAPDPTPKRDHALIIEDDRIIALEPSDAARYPDARHIELPGHALLPGFVNAHTHAAMNLLRGTGSDCALMDWLQNHVWPLEARLLSPEFVEHGVELACAEMLRGGTTTFGDMYMFPDATARVADRAGLRAVVGLPVIDFPTPYAADLDAYLARAAETIEQTAGHPRIGCMLAPHAPYTVCDASLARVLDLADRHALRLQMHLHETADEVQRAVAESGERPLARLARMGVLERPFMAVHMTQLDADELDCIAEHGVHVVHCPESNLKLASGFCPVHALQQRGVNVALGTDGAASNNDLDLLGEMRSAALLAKAIAADASAVAAPVALEMATLAGARALGLDAQIGSLEPGKQADLIAIDLDRIETLPEHDPASAVVYAACREQITHVWVAGRELLADRHLTTLDEQRIRRQARSWQQRRDAC